MDESKWTLKFYLAREARSKGGDRYECKVEGEDRPVVLYFPQAISRPSGVAVNSLVVRVSYDT